VNDVIEAIKNRRSVRSYDARPVPRDLINKVIEAGNEAPSAMNSQPWRFVIVEDQEAKRKLDRNTHTGRYASCCGISPCGNIT